MRRRVGTKWGLSRQPIDLMNRPVRTNKKGFSSPSTMVLLNWFSKAPGHLKFKYDHSDNKWIDVDSVIATVTFTYNANS